ncbi:MAG: energy-coupling factor transporter transmembrane component T, partial [Lachnospiraceae bacterium]|nr:energy-coupling factor transporter transmembrane component T [Lachnospiraceae bacterium]
MNRLLSYEEKNTWLHHLSGITKLLFFLIWCFTSALTYDTRVLLVMIAVSAVLYIMSGTRWQQVSTVFGFIMVFMVLNLVAIFIFSPYQGTQIYGTKTVLTAFLPGHAITREELFYLFNVMIKYFTVVPSVFIFMVTTNPSEFAASMNRIGVPYTISYSVALALRYIPDVQSDYRRIRNAQEARGIEMSAKAKLKDRIRRTSSIIFPLLFSAMDHIDVVSNAMELRGFGKKKKRTWYAYRKLQPMDYAVLAATVLFSAAALIITFA